MFTPLFIYLFIYFTCQTKEVKKKKKLKWQGHLQETRKLSVFINRRKCMDLL